MASIYKRDNADGTKVWRAVVRIKGYPAICNHFERKQEAEDWAADVERQIKQGRFNFNLHKAQYTFAQLLERYRNDGALEHIRSVEDVIRHLEYWKDRFGDYELVHVTPELIGQERRLLAETPANKGKERNPATVNRYVSSLSALLSHAVRLKWINENPCFGLSKLKENSGRDGDHGGGNLASIGRLQGKQIALSLLHRANQPDDRCKARRNSESRMASR